MNIKWGLLLLLRNIGLESADQLTFFFPPLIYLFICFCGRKGTRLYMFPLPLFSFFLTFPSITSTKQQFSLISSIFVFVFFVFYKSNCYLLPLSLSLSPPLALSLPSFYYTVFFQEMLTKQKKVPSLTSDMTIPRWVVFEE